MKLSTVLAIGVGALVLLAVSDALASEAPPEPVKKEEDGEEDLLDRTDRIEEEGSGSSLRA